MAFGCHTYSVNLECISLVTAGIARRTDGSQQGHALNTAYRPSSMPTGRSYFTVINTQFSYSPGKHQQVVSDSILRVLSELGCANTLEAKSRLERANQTLRDRLVKEIRS